MRDNQMPPEDILNGVRHIAGWTHWFSIKVGKEMENEKRRSYFRDKLRSIMNELEIDILHIESIGTGSGEYKLTYTVAHRETIQLVFTDLIRDKTDLRTLESVRTYHAALICVTRLG